ncbi:MAG TPA: M12 family metallo-peptidase, partial [Woeseiaceae bacterium]|nr:M12 family metallo-peptidase [Woeseiaceae bacterium]
TDPSTLLADLGGYKSRQPDLGGLGLVHLYTGRDLDDNTAGIAYLGALCNSRFGASLSEGRRTTTTDSLIGAHEIGHNFGAPHDGEDGSLCESTPGSFLMAPQLNGSSTFSACSLEQIAPEVASALCLRDLPDADMSIAATAAPATALEGTVLTLELTATNLGTAAAELVSMSVDLPAGLHLQDPGSLCAAAAGGAECSLGAVSAGSSATAGLVLSAVSAGRTSVDVEVRADSDVQPSNDKASVPVHIEPAADLGISLGATDRLTPGASATLDLTVANASARSASDLVVQVTVPSLLTPTAVQSTAVDCTVTGGEIRCATPALAGGDSLAIGLTVAAARDGTGTLRAQVSAAEGDPHAADNTASRSIEVSSPAAGGSTGGGGGGLWLLLLAAGLATAARRRP